MKFYKNWPDWLKGGVIFAMSAIVFWIILCAVGFIIRPSEDNGVAWILAFISVPLIIPAFIFPSLRQVSQQFFIVPLILASITMYFIIGAMVGFFYGKNKNRKKLKG